VLDVVLSNDGQYMLAGFEVVLMLTSGHGKNWMPVNLNYVGANNIDTVAVSSECQYIVDTENMLYYTIIYRLWETFLFMLISMMIAEIDGLSKQKLYIVSR